MQIINSLDKREIQALTTVKYSPPIILCLELLKSLPINSHPLYGSHKFLRAKFCSSQANHINFISYSKGLDCLKFQQSMNIETIPDHMWLNCLGSHDPLYSYQSLGSPDQSGL